MTGVNSSQFNSVSQFYQSVLCFILPLLVIQQCYLWLRSINTRYQQMRFKSFQQELKWIETTQLERQVGKSEELQQKNNQQKVQQQQDSQRPVRNQPEQQKTEQVRDKSSSKGSRDSKGSQKSKDSKEQEQMNENYGQQKEKPRQKSLTQIISIQNTKKSLQKIQDPSQAKKNEQNKAENENNKQIDPVEAHRQKQLTLQQQQKIQRALRYIIRIDVAFEEYIPVILSILVIGILTHSVYVFSMVCFFGYVFSALLFNYADLLSKLRRGLTRNSIFNKLNYLISGLFIIALFISYFIDTEYKLS